MIGDPRWSDNCRVIVPPGAVRFDLPRLPTRRRRVGRQIRELPPGTAVVLVASGPGATRRCASVASAAAIELERSFLAFPSSRAPGYLVEDSPATIRLFLRTGLATPPRAAWAMPLEAGLTILRRLQSARLVRLLSPGLLAIGTVR